ncbi:hypothetical protein GCK72_004542 [Caenorhabditis remanei]|uniref:Uncharacterized protein n=1 Tax=Caenorhabditis remanei TaxID=31234 RepID=A0A6A5HDY1_CAERE|nr:hypothetical protein GCK72_004542 [Caenorhabditis remanei]KAF1764593.1 hypothetical protein GCK72_004542 [Caenorhabditis remanei]
MAEKGEDGLKSKDDEEKSVVPVIPKKSEDNIVEKDEKKIGEKCAEKKENAASSKKKEEKSPKSVVSCETASKNERRLNTSIEKGNSGRTTKIPFLLEISPQKLVVPPSEPLKVTVRNPTEDTQTLRCTFDSYYFLVDFKDAKSSGQHGVTPAAAYGCYELGPGESCSLTVRTTDREIDQSVDLKTLMNGTYNVIKPFPHLPRLKDRRNIIDIAFYNYDRPEGFLRFQYRKKEKGSNAKWVVRRKQLHLTDDIRKMIRLEEQKSVEEEKGKEENETATDPNPPVYMKFHRMKWIYYATQRHQSWKGSWGEQLMNDDDGTHRVFPVRRDSAVEQFLKDKENYNKTLGTEEDNINFWTNVFVKEHIGKYAVDRNERKKKYFGSKCRVWKA